MVGEREENRLLILLYVSREGPVTGTDVALKISWLNV